MTLGIRGEEIAPASEWRAEIKTTFASTYAKEVSLAEALRIEEIMVYSKQATGAKYLINPNKKP